MALLSSPLPVVAGNLRPVQRRSPPSSCETSLKFASDGRRNRRLSSSPAPRAAKREESSGDAAKGKPQEKKVKGLGKIVTGLGDVAKKVPGSELAGKGKDVVFKFTGEVVADVSDVSEKIADNLEDKVEDAASEASEIIDKLFGGREPSVPKVKDILDEFSEKAGKLSPGNDLPEVTEEETKNFDELLAKTKSRVSEIYQIVDELNSKAGAPAPENIEKARAAISEAAELVEKVAEKSAATISQPSDIIENLEEVVKTEVEELGEATQLVEEVAEKSGSVVSQPLKIIDNLKEVVETEAKELIEAAEIVDEFAEKSEAAVAWSSEIIDNLKEVVETEAKQLIEAAEIVDKFAEKSEALAAQSSEVIDNLKEAVETEAKELREAAEIVDKFAEKSEAAVSKSSEIIDNLKEVIETEASELRETAEIVDKLAEKSEAVASKSLEIIDKLEEIVEKEAEELVEKVKELESGVIGIIGDLSRNDEIEDLKLCLVDTLYGTELGFTASSEVRSEVFDLVSQLEALNPTPAPMESPRLLDGNWILLYTAFSELLPLLAIGTVPSLKVKRISQEIDTRKTTIKNSITISSPLASFTFSASASFKVQTPSRIQVKFREGSFEPPELSPRVDLPESTEVFGRRLDLNPMRQVLDPLQGAAGGIARAVSGLQPIKVPIPGERNQSWLITTFLDRDLRISRGDGGLFILARKGSSLLSN